MNGALAAGTGTLSGGKAGRPDEPMDSEYYTGAVSDEYASTNGAVTISDGGVTFTYKQFYGGYSLGTVSENSITINGGSFENGCSFLGAYGFSAATGNTLTITGGSFGDENNFWGGSAWNTVSGNSIIISGGSFGINNKFCGGYFGNSISGNTLTISGGTFGDKNEFYGGYSSNGTVSGNTVKFSGGFFSGGWDFRNIFYGGYSENDNVTGNMIEISDGTFKGENYFYGGYSKSGEASGNIVKISGGTFMTFEESIRSIYGGGTLNGGAANYNEITILDGEFNAVYVNGVSAGGGGEATGNIVNIFGGTFNDVDFYAADTSGNAYSNVLNISGGIFQGGCQFYATCLSSGKIAENNELNITGGTFDDGYQLYGGVASSINTGNILNLKIKMGGKATCVENFQIMNFTLPSDIAKDDIMLSTASVTFDNTTIGVDADNGVKLKKGDIITLIAADSKNGDISNADAYVLDNKTYNDYLLDKIILGYNKIEADIVLLDQGFVDEEFTADALNKEVILSLCAAKSKALSLGDKESQKCLLLLLLWLY